MDEAAAVRLLRAGLIAPGWNERDVEALTKAGALRDMSPTPGGKGRGTNRGAYFSDVDDVFSWLGGSQRDRKPSRTVSFPVLRIKLIQSPIDKLIILRRKMQVRKVARRCVVPGKQVGYRVVHERYADPTFTPDERTLERCREMEKLIGRVVREINGDLRGFASTAVAEELTIDRKAMLRFNRPGTNKPVAYNLVPGDSILPRIEVLLPFMKERGLDNIGMAAEMYSQDLRSRGITDENGNEIDLTKAAWVQVIDERIRGAWSKDEMDVDIVNREIELDQIMYGKSALEQSLELTDLFINSFQYNMTLFAPNFPEHLLIVKGDYDTQALETFKRTILQQSNISGVQRVPVITGDDKEFEVTLEELRKAPKDAQFVDLLRIVIALKCAAYGMHPSEINFSPDGGGSKAMINEGDEDMAQEAATEDGFFSILDNLAAWWTKALIEPHYDDLLVIWDGLKRDNEKGKVEINQLKVESYATLEEVRGEENMGVLDFDPQNPSTWDPRKIPLNQQMIALLQLIAQNKQMEMQMQMQSGMPEIDKNADYGQESRDAWHQAGQGPREDYGAEEPDWFMDGQENASGRSNFGSQNAPSGLPSQRQKQPQTQKSLRPAKPESVKYIRLVYEDE